MYQSSQGIGTCGYLNLRTPQTEILRKHDLLEYTKFYETCKFFKVESKTNGDHYSKRRRISEKEH